MTVAEGIVGFVASVIAIITALIVGGRYLGKKIDNKIDAWINAVIENSTALRTLTERVARLEGAMEKVDGGH